MTTTPACMYDGGSVYMDPVASGGNGIGTVSSGNYGLVALFQNATGTTTLTDPPVVSWGLTPLTNYGGAYLGGSPGSGLILVYGGYVSGGIVNFSTASGTAFAGWTWAGVFSGVNTASALQTKSGDQDTPPGGSVSLGGLQVGVVAASVPFNPAATPTATQIGTVVGINCVIGVGPREPTVTAEWATPSLHGAGVWASAVVNLN